MTVVALVCAAGFFPAWWWMSRALYTQQLITNMLARQGVEVVPWRVGVACLAWWPAYYYDASQVDADMERWTR